MEAETDSPEDASPVVCPSIQLSNHSIFAHLAFFNSTKYLDLVIFVKSCLLLLDVPGNLIMQ